MWVGRIVSCTPCIARLRRDRRRAATTAAAATAPIDAYLLRLPIGSSLRSMFVLDASQGVGPDGTVFHGASAPAGQVPCPEAALTMEHVIAPLDTDHVRAVRHLADEAVAAAGLSEVPPASTAHVTLLAYAGLLPDDAADAMAATVAAAAPFSVHAHGYGMFTGVEPKDLSLHVPVVRTRSLDAFHRGLHGALLAAGAHIAGWSGPDTWSPHITLVDRGLDPATLGAAVTWLARRPHPSWRVPIERVAITGGWPERQRLDCVLTLGRATGPPPPTGRGRPPP